MINKKYIKIRVEHNIVDDRYLNREFIDWSDEVV
jgi:hypothetical protein